MFTVQSSNSGTSTLRHMGGTQKDLSSNLEKLSSGYAINKAADDAAGLAISEKMKSLITEMGRVEKNIGEGLSVTNIADGALQEVNSMLIRAEELCILAANGTYSQSERDHMRSEITALYEEIDRIFTSTSFNEIKLFDQASHKNQGFGVGSVVGQSFITNTTITETITPLDEAQYIPSTDMPNVYDTDFSLTIPSAPSTATLQLSSSSVRYPETMINSMFYINGVEIRLDEYMLGSYPSDATEEERTMYAESFIFNAINSYYNYSGEIPRVTDVSISSDYKVTFTFEVQDEDIIYNGNNGEDVVYKAENSLGEYANGTVVSSQNGIQLGSVSSTGDITYYGDGLLVSDFLILGSYPDDVDINDLFQDEDMLVLRANMIYLAGYEIRMDDIIDGMTSSPITIGGIREAINDTINNLSPDISSVLNSDGSLNVELTGSYLDNPSDQNHMYSTANGIIGDFPVEGLEDGTFSSVTNNATAESVQSNKITLPQPFPKEETVFTVGDYTFAILDISNNNTNTSILGSFYSIQLDLENTTDEDIYNAILSNIGMIIGWNSGFDADITLEDNVINITGKYSNTSMNLDFTSEDKTFSLYPNDLTNKSEVFAQEYSIDIDLASDLGDPIDISNLVNTGFRFNGTWFEFSDGSSNFTQQVDYSTIIDLNGATSLEDVLSRLNMYMHGDTRVELDENNMFKFFAPTNINPEDTYNKFLNGFKQDGLFFSTDTNNFVEEVSSGGRDSVAPQATIDFSNYNENNIHTLLGQGFRVTCASCPDEYINVMFMNQNTGDVPEYFLTDSGEIIKNYVIEIDGLTSGTDIVNEILKTLNPNVLDHTNEMYAGTPSSTLVIADKRPADLSDNTGVLRAELQNGIYTNYLYEYTITHEEILVETEKEPDLNLDFEVETSAMYIFVGSSPDDREDEFIAINLPKLNVENLDLVPPNPILDSVQDAMKMASLHRKVNEIISECRSVIGADHNRLEYADFSNSNAKIQMQSANSRIVDTDMAKEMMRKVKNEILQDAQTSMMAQINTNASMVLQLLQ